MNYSQEITNVLKDSHKSFVIQEPFEYMDGVYAVPVLLSDKTVYFFLDRDKKLLLDRYVSKNEI